MQSMAATGFPQSLIDFDEHFDTEEACCAYLQQLRWPEGFRCPACGHGAGWTLAARRLIECTSCSRQTSVTAGTVLHRTRKPLRLWFTAMWMMATRKTGLSAADLKRSLGLTYKVAWTWLHKLRRAMVRPNRERLSGRVEVDEAFIACLAPRVDPTRTIPVQIAVETPVGGGIGRVRLQAVADKSAASLMPALAAAVEPGSVVHTDGWTSYNGLDAAGYTHEVTVVGRDDRARGSRLLPRVHLVASLLRRFLLGTYQGAAKSGHIQHYLDEFTFRFNRRTSRSVGKIFMRLVQQATAVLPTTYRQMVGDPVSVW